MTPALERSPLADLLRGMTTQLQRLGPALQIHWMKSHSTRSAALEAGVTAEAWHGNTLADEAAKEAARELAPSADPCQQRSRFAELHVQACRLIAAVQEMHMYYVRNTLAQENDSVRPAFPHKRKRPQPPGEERSAKRRSTGRRLAQAVWQDRQDQESSSSSTVCNSKRLGC